MLVAMSRLWSTVRPIRGRLFLGLLSALAASIVLDLARLRGVA